MYFVFFADFQLFFYFIFLRRFFTVVHALFCVVLCFILLRDRKERSGALVLIFFLALFVPTTVVVL